MKDNITIKLFGKKLDFNFPSIGELMEIESMKQKMTLGTYGDMVSSNTMSARFNLDLTDAISYFSTLNPNFKKNLAKISDKDNIFDLPAMNAKVIVKAYREEFKPWIDSFLEQLYTEVDDEKNSSGKEE